MKTVCIVDYGMGNIASIENALQALGARATVSSDPAVVGQADSLILPGVGAFGEGMAALAERGLVEPLVDSACARNTPLLGICLGMQLFASRSTEHGRHNGLGIIPGTVDLMRPADPRCPVPHVGWNDVEFTQALPLFAGIKSQADFYFVHSYVFLPDSPGHVAGVCRYDRPFAAVVASGNVHGVQFHPEKSHKAGLQLLKNFLSLE